MGCCAASHWISSLATDDKGLLSKEGRARLLAVARFVAFGLPLAEAVPEAPAQRPATAKTTRLKNAPLAQAVRGQTSSLEEAAKRVATPCRQGAGRKLKNAPLASVRSTASW